MEIRIRIIKKCHWGDDKYVYEIPVIKWMMIMTFNDDNDAAVAEEDEKNLFIPTYLLYQPTCQFSTLSIQINRKMWMLNGIV